MLNHSIQWRNLLWFLEHQGTKQGRKYLMGKCCENTYWALNYVPPETKEHNLSTPFSTPSYMWTFCITLFIQSLDLNYLLTNHLLNLYIMVSLTICPLSAHDNSVSLLPPDMPIFTRSTSSPFLHCIRSDVVPYFVFNHPLFNLHLYLTNIPIPIVLTHFLTC